MLLPVNEHNILWNYTKSRMMYHALWYRVVMTMIILLMILKETEKKSKYKDLELEVQRMWQMKTEVIPVVVGGLGTIKKGWSACWDLHESLGWCAVYEQNE